MNIEETISEEQVLHNELSFEINIELIHLMKRIVQLQRENKTMQEKIDKAVEDLATLFGTDDEDINCIIRELKGEKK